MKPYRSTQKPSDSAMGALRFGSSVNEFYKKGCQEKKLRLDRSRDLILEIQPTLYMPRWRSFAFSFS